MLSAKKGGHFVLASKVLSIPNKQHFGVTVPASLWHKGNPQHTATVICGPFYLLTWFDFNPSVDK